MKTINKVVAMKLAILNVDSNLDQPITKEERRAITSSRTVLGALAVIQADMKVETQNVFLALMENEMQFGS